MTIEPAAVQAGDLILVFSDAKTSVLTTGGQTVILAAMKGVRELHLARYSHVMLGIRPGLVIHSDGRSVKIATLHDALHGRTIEESRFRVVRPQPPLDSGDEERVFSEAKYFLNERYSFIFGRTSTRFGRLMHRRRPLTHPFCSELVASAYAAIGRPIVDQPADTVLPVDLEIACVPPDWIDVTADYAARPLPHIPGETITVEGRALSLPEFSSEMDAALARTFDNDAEVAAAHYEVASAVVRPGVIAQQLRSAEFDLAKALAAAPTEMLARFPALVKRDLQALLDFYGSIVTHSYASATPFAASMQKLLPGVPSDRRAYEALPSVDEMRRLEQLGAALAFAARALRLDTALRALAIGCRMPLRSDARFAAVTPEMVAPFIAMVPRWPATELDKVKQHIALIDLGDERFTAAVRGLCETVAALHAALSILIYQATA